MDVDTTPMTDAVNLRDELEAVGIEEILSQLDRELIGLKPVKTRIREIASLLLIERIRKRMGLASEAPTLHMSFTGNPGTGKTTVALRIASILHRLGFVRRGQVVSVTRDELVGQYIGHTAPKTKEILKKAMGGVLFIDEAYYLHRPDNERDYGQEAIEILLQVMESQREDLVVILAGYGDRMDKFFASNPGFRSRIAHHIDFPDYADDELLAIAELMLRDMNYGFTTEARAEFVRYIALRKNQPLFSNARSIRNALDRLRLRQANRLVADLDHVLTADDIRSIEASDVLASRVFGKGGKSGRSGLASEKRRQTNVRRPFIAPGCRRQGYLPLVSTFCFSSSFIFFTTGSRLASPVVWVVVAGGLSFGMEVCPGGVVAGRVAVALGGDVV